VWIRANGPIPAGFVVHHLNGNKQDNDLKNLRVMSRAEHRRIHQDRQQDHESLTGRGKLLHDQLTDEGRWQSRHHHRQGATLEGPGGGDSPESWL